MGRGSRCTLAVFLAFLLFSVLLACCSPAQRPTNELTEDLLMRTLPSSLGVRRRDIRPIRHGSEEAREYCVFYEVGEGLEVYTNAVMYRLADEMHSPLTVPLPSLRPYTLPFPCSSERLCECSCRIESGNLLAPYAHQLGNELIIRDQCEDRTTRLFIYHWLSDAERYEDFGFFDGYDIHYDPGITNRITVDYQSRPGAEWVHRCLYLSYERTITRGTYAVAAQLDSHCNEEHKDCELVFYGKTPSPR